MDFLSKDLPKDAPELRDQVLAAFRVAFPQVLSEKAVAHDGPYKGQVGMTVTDTTVPPVLAGLLRETAMAMLGPELSMMFEHTVLPHMFAQGGLTAFVAGALWAKGALGPIAALAAKRVTPP